MKVDGRTRLGRATKGWTWAMWLGLAYWHADFKRSWEGISEQQARQWVSMWEPHEIDILMFLDDLPKMQEGHRHRFTSAGCVLFSRALGVL